MTVYLPLASAPSVVNTSMRLTLPWSSAWYWSPIDSGLNFRLFSP